MEEQKSINSIIPPSLSSKSEASSYVGSENHQCSSEEFANTRNESSVQPSESSFGIQIVQTEKKAFSSGKVPIL